MFEYVTTNLKTVVRQDQMEGKDWVVAPAQMITEGVHNGSDGPIFYPEEELAKLPEVWNHKPVVVYHPTVNGEQVSACTPIQLSTRKVGVLMNTVWNGETKKLATETWLDPVRINAIDPRVAESITKNEMMEVSTGVYMDLERKEGEWNGEKYIGIAHNLAPDHLALLPDVKGACSIDDGAGFLRNNEERRKMVINSVINAMSHDEIHRTLSNMIWTKEESGWIEEVHDDYFIYEVEGKLYKQSYNVKDSVVSLEGLATLVVREVTYKEVTALAEKNTINVVVKNEKGSIMDKTKKVDALIKNEKTSWTEEHREKLMGLDEDVLTNMLAPIVALSEEVTTLTEKIAKPEVKPDPVVKNEQTVDEPKTLKQYVNEAPAEVREMLEESMATLNAEKDRLVASIMANAKNTFTKEHLESLKVDMLRAIGKMATEPTENEDNTMQLYFGGQQDVPTGNEQLPEPLLLPSLDTKTA